MKDFLEGRHDSVIASACSENAGCVSVHWRAHLLLRLSSENGFDGRLTLDLPRSTFQDPGETTGEGEPSSSRVLLRPPSRGDLLGDCGGRDISH